MCVCECQCVLKGVRADGVGFRDQESQRLRVKHRGRENKSVVRFRGLEGEHRGQRLAEVKATGSKFLVVTKTKLTC